MDDDALITRSLTRALRTLSDRLHVEVAHSGAEALVALERAAFDAVITDLQMPGVSGVEWLRQLRRAHPQLPCLVHSSQLESFGEDEVRRLAHATLAKPASLPMLLDALQRVWRSETVQAGGLRSA